MANISYKKSSESSLLGRVKALKNFALEITRFGFWLPTSPELKGTLRPELDFHNCKGEVIANVNKYVYARFLALIRYLTEDLSQILPTKDINCEKIKTEGNNALYRAWYGTDIGNARYFYLSQNPDPKDLNKGIFRYRTASAEINHNATLTRLEWVSLKEMITVSGKEVKVRPITNKAEKAAVLNAFFYSLELKKIKQMSIDDYKKSDNKKNRPFEKLKPELAKVVAKPLSEKKPDAKKVSTTTKTASVSKKK